MRVRKCVCIHVHGAPRRRHIIVKWLRDVRTVNQIRHMIELDQYIWLATAPTAKHTHIMAQTFTS